MKRIMTVVGVRPEFVKLAPVSRAMRHVGLNEILVHTGQHTDPVMSDALIAELGLPAPAHHLAVANLGHGAMVGRMLENLESVIALEHPDLVVVHGDTNSALAGALAASKCHVPVAHLEAGLRSFNRRMPEEINRVIIDHIASLNFCPTEAGARNLLAEGVHEGVHLVGDVMQRATLEAIERARRHSRVLADLQLAPRMYALATVHRAENTRDDVRFHRIIRWLEEAAAQLPIIVPLHPGTRKQLNSMSIVPVGLRLIEPLPYHDIIWLAHNAAAIYTDSGGLQKEAQYHRVPCVTLRDDTEWVETIDCGWNRLWTTNHYATRREIPNHGSGRSAELVASILRDAIA